MGERERDRDRYTETKRETHRTMRRKYFGLNFPNGNEWAVKSSGERKAKLW